jgi:hypothetical protein
MNNDYTRLGPIEHQQCASGNPQARALRLWATAYRCCHAWRNIDLTDEQSPAGVGFPVLASDGSTVNFLKIRPVGDTFEESLIHGYPVAECHVLFGKRTKDILIAVDCVSAMVLHLATDLGTVAVLYGDNLIGECKRLKARYPDSSFKVCFNGEGRIGDPISPVELQACEAARAIDAMVVASGSSTFANLYRKVGPDAVCQRVDLPKPALKWVRDRWNKCLKIPRSPVPWSHGFDGVCLLANLIAAIRRHVAMSDDLALMVSLWIIHTHVIESARFSPMLAVVSQDYGTGKATLMAVLQRLCKDAYRTSKITSGDLLRMIRQHRLTMLLDDGDSVLRNQSFVDILNASHDRLSGGITTALKNEFVAMDVFVAKAMKSHVGLPDSLARRSIKILLQRKRPNEKILPVNVYSSEVNDELAALHAQLVRWAEDHLAGLKDVVSSPIDLGNDRCNDTFGPLLAIAQVIGGDALTRAESIARELLTPDDAKSEGVQLLENIKELLQASRIEKIHSIDLVTKLCAQTQWPWVTCNKGKPLDQLLLAKILGGYGIKPDNIRIGDESKRGYWSDDFRDAFARYVPEADRDAPRDSTSGC